MIKNLILSFVLLYSVVAFSQRDSLSNGSDTKNEKVIKGWQPGYIVLKGHNDTMFGETYVQRLYFTFHTPLVKFYKKTGKERYHLEVNNQEAWYYNDTIQLFGYANKKYKWINYVDETMPVKRRMFYTIRNLIWNYRMRKHPRLLGFAEVVEEGKLNLCKGYSNPLPPGYAIYPFFNYRKGMYGMPCFYLSKENRDPIIVQFCTHNRFKMHLRLKGLQKEALENKNKQHLLNYIADDSELVAKWSSKSITINDVQKIVKEYNEKK